MTGTGSTLTAKVPVAPLVTAVPPQRRRGIGTGSRRKAVAATANANVSRARRVSATHTVLALPLTKSAGDAAHALLTRKRRQMLSAIIDSCEQLEGVFHVGASRAPRKPEAPSDADSTESESLAVHRQVELEGTAPPVTDDKSRSKSDSEDTSPHHKDSEDVRVVVFTESPLVGTVSLISFLLDCVQEYVASGYRAQEAALQHRWRPGTHHMLAACLDRRTPQARELAHAHDALLGQLAGTTSVTHCNASAFTTTATAQLTQLLDCISACGWPLLDKVARVRHVRRLLGTNVFHWQRLKKALDSAPSAKKRLAHVRRIAAELSDSSVPSSPTDSDRTSVQRFALHSRLPATRTGPSRQQRARLRCRAASV